MRSAAWVAMAVLVAGCGTPGASDSPDAPNTGPDIGTDGGEPPVQKTLMPLAIGSKWVYRVTDPIAGTVAQKTTIVSEQRDLDGAKAGVHVYVVESEVSGLKSVTFVEPKGEIALRHREDTLQNGSLVESRMVLPSSTRGPITLPHANQRWHDAYTEDSYGPDGSFVKSRPQEDDWEVEAMSERVTVPAGSYDAVRLKRTRLDNGKIRTTWWVPGIGKVKEDDAGYIEELVSVQLP